MSQWSEFRDYINSTEIGGIITRQEFLEKVYKKPEVWRSYSQGTPVDNYRLYLENLGILSRVGPGVFKVNYHINESVSIGEINKRAYEYKSWQQWFMLDKDRIGHIIKSTSTERV